MTTTRAVSQPQALNDLGRRRRWERGVERVGFELDQQTVAVLRDGMRSRGRDVERQPRERAERFETARRRAARARRRRE